MKELEIQKYLRSGKSLENMEAELFIKYAICDEIPVVALNYNQITADMSLPAVQECRGLYLELNTWDVVARAFDKFFNSVEGGGQKVLEIFDWNSAMANNKIDGTMINCYNYKGKWYTGTRSSATATGSCGSLDISFNDLINATLKEMNFDLNILDNTKCYTFELTSPLNRVVVPYEDYRLTWIGCRDMINGEELDIETLPDITAKKVKRFDLKTMDDIVAFVATLSPSEAEGIVLMDKNFNRVKIKSEQYCAIHRAISYAETPRQRIGVLLCDDYDDVYGLLPKSIQVHMDLLKAKLNKLLSDTVTTYNSIKHIEVQKEFAMEALKYQYSAWLFDMRKGKTIDDCLKNTTTEKLEYALDKIQLD